MKSYQVLARKWRPRTFQAMIGQEHVLQMLTNALEQNRLHHAYLFTGTRGVGKTTLGRLLAKCLNCETGITANPCNTCKNCTAIDDGRFLDLIEVDAASRTKVEDTRELLENVQYQPVQGRFKVYLIDEVHMLSGHSFNALLKTLEEPPPYVKFLLATTDPKRLPITILSRCLQLNLKRVPVLQIAEHLQHICQTENLSFDKQALQLLAEAADGSLRDALSLLDQAIAFCGEKITLPETQQMLGSVEQDALFRLLQALVQRNGQQLLTEIALLAEYAVDFDQAMDNILSILHTISMTQVIGTKQDQYPQIAELAKCISAEDIQLYYQIALIGRRDLSLAPNPQQGFEMAMLRMLAFSPLNVELPKTIQKPIPPVQNNKPVSAMSQSQPATQNKILASPQQTTSNDWNSIVNQLNLSGMALALATNCTIAQTTDTKMTLALSPQHEAMCNKKLVERIEQSLQRYLNKPITLDIQITAADTTQTTPAKQREEQQVQQQSAATAAIKNDQHVQKIMDVFGATLDENSIKSI
jgi:DNA polymerase-3 subunit gamma/tau